MIGKAKVFKAPEKVENPDNLPSVFLAGSIDNGRAENWQKELTEVLSDVACIVLNPRRDDWDSSWVQSIENEQFREQVEWELKGMEKATMIAMCFTKDSQAPISLLELGLHASDGKMIVFCPSGYWRKGNVDVVCKRYGVPVFESFNEFKAKVKEGMLDPKPINKVTTASDRVARRETMKEFTMGMKKVNAHTPHLELPQYPIQQGEIKIDRIAKSLVAALDGMNNAKARKEVNKVLSLYTRGFFTDTYWAPVDNIFKALSAGQVNWELKDTKYFDDKLTGKSAGKQWRFEVYFNNDKGRHTVLHGVIIASFAGTNDDPSGRYDLTSYVS